MNDALIQHFNQIRDIPYRIPLSLQESDHCCSGKSIQLKALLEKEELEVRFRVCEFNWSDVKLPLRVIQVPHDNTSTHSYLEVLIDGKWKNVDPTWDRGLQSIFPIAEWDGVHDTIIAVTPTSTYDLEKSREIMEHSSNEAIEDDLKKNGEFYKTFNLWLEEARTS